jgi:hypothetical protein
MDSKNEALNEKTRKLSEINNILAGYQRQNITFYQKVDRLTKKLHTCESRELDTNILFYILIGFVTVELVIIVILLWRCKSKNVKIEPSQHFGFEANKQNSDKN